VALAASAAPTFFPIAEIKDSLFVDGGLYANSPDYMALHEAEFFLKQKSDDISLLSIGTTTSKFSFSHENGRDLGISQWASGQKLIQATISSQQSITDYIMKQKLADRYFRIDEQQSKDQERDLGLDVATRAAQKTIRGLADASVQRVSSLPFITQALSNMAAPSIFFHTLE
jgi:patatin-like phospholipase/acyl hydrolase